MTRYIVSPVAGKPHMARIYDTKNQKHIRTDWGNDEFLKEVAQARAKRMNADMIGRKGGAS